MLHPVEEQPAPRPRRPGQRHPRQERREVRALDVEQIGHVYEGLLDHTAARASEPIVGLVGRDGSGPDLPLYQLESWAQEGPDRLLESLKAETRRTAKAVEKGLYEEVDYERLLREKLYKIPGIRHSKSSFVLRVLKDVNVPVM